MGADGDVSIEHMILLLMRHGEAEAAAFSDFDRRLTEKGRRGVQEVAVKLAEKGLIADVIYSSPYPRAMATAQIMSEALAASISEQGLLVPDGQPADVIGFLDRNAGASIESGAGGVLLVTHQPLVGRLIKLLTGEEVPMRTANVAVVEAETIVAGFGELKCVI